MIYIPHERLNDVPPPLRWALICIKEVGFPIVICLWMAYQQMVSGKETIKAIDGFKEVMIEVKQAMIQTKETLEQQNRILRHSTRSRDD